MNKSHRDIKGEPVVDYKEKLTELTSQPKEGPCDITKSKFESSLKLNNNSKGLYLKDINKLTASKIDVELITVTNHKPNG